MKESGPGEFQISGTIIFNNTTEIIRIYNTMGARVLISDNSRIDIQSLLSGAYIVRVHATGTPFTIFR